MKTEELTPDEFNFAERPEVVNTDELISDFSFMYKLSKRNTILDFDYELHGFCIE